MTRYRSPLFLAVVLSITAPRAASAEGIYDEVIRQLESAYQSEMRWEDEYGSDERRYPSRPAEVGVSPAEDSEYTLFFAEAGEVWRQGAEPKTERPEDAVILGPDERAHPGIRVYTSVAETGCPVNGIVGEKPGVGVRTEGKAQDILLLAAANLDDDDALDCWSIATFSRVVGTTPVPRGMAFHEQADHSPAMQSVLGVVHSVETTIAGADANDLKRVRPRALLRLAGLLGLLALLVFGCIGWLWRRAQRVKFARIAAEDDSKAL